MSLMRPKTKAKPTAPPRPTAPGVVLGAFLRHNWRPIGILLGWVLGLGGVAYGLQRMEPLARSTVRGETRIEIANLPGWLNDPNWQQVLRDVIASVPDVYPDTQIYDDSVCKWVADHIAASPWAAKLERVTKANDGRVLVYAEFRKPFTLIERGERAYLIDRSGTLLPSSISTRDVAYDQWITLRGAKAASPPIGSVWPGADVQDGLKLADFLMRVESNGQLPVRPYLRSIDVSQHDPKIRQLRILMSKPGAFVFWGVPPHEEYGVEASAERKLAALCEESKIRAWVTSGESIDIRAGEWVDRFLAKPTP